MDCEIMFFKPVTPKAFQPKTKNPSYAKAITLWQLGHLEELRGKIRSFPSQPYGRFGFV
jgi:hypothetical protein